MRKKLGFLLEEVWQSGKGQAASYGRLHLGALCPPQSLTSVAALHDWWQLASASSSPPESLSEDAN
jgi:hypothetical protein